MLPESIFCGKIFLVIVIKTVY